MASQCSGVINNCGIDFKVCLSPGHSVEHSCGPIFYEKGNSFDHVYSKCINVKIIVVLCTIA